MRLTGLIQQARYRAVTAALSATKLVRPVSAVTNTIINNRSFVSTASLNSLIKPHGPTGELMDSSVMLAGPALTAAKSEANRLPELVLSKRQLCDLELIMNGGFSPLTGFMNETDYNTVVHTMRLSDTGKTLFPMPITLDVNDKLIERIKIESIKSLSLKDPEGNILAIIDIESIYKPNKLIESQLVFGGDLEHPAIKFLNSSNVGNYYIGGRIRGLSYPHHYDHLDLRHNPRQVRSFINSQQSIVNNPYWKSIVAFQTRNPLHRAHYELTARAMSEINGALLLHPVVGLTKPGDIDHHTRVKCYRAIMNRYNSIDSTNNSNNNNYSRALLSALPLAMRMAGPREAIWHSIIRQNYGATHFIIGRDHAGPGSNSSGKDFYTPYEARDLALKYQSELGIKLLPFEQMVYVPTESKYYPINALPKPNIKTENLSGTEVRRRLLNNIAIPEWFSFPEIVNILQSMHPPASKQGFCLFFTGLSGSGKSTIANALLDRIMSIDSRSVILLDGDHVRQLLSSELNFSEEHRNLNIKRIGYVSSLITQSGGIAIAAPIAPYAGSRQFAREQVNGVNSQFIEIYVSTSVELCEKRDRKGLYAKYRAGLMKQMTGLDDPYEVPTKAELNIDTGITTVAAAVDLIMEYLHKRGFITAAQLQSTNSNKEIPIVANSANTAELSQSQGKTQTQSK